MDQAARREDWERIVRAAEAKLRQAPDDPLLRLELGRKYFGVNRIEEALPLLDSAARDPRAFATASFYLARCRMRQRAYDLAINPLKAAERTVASDSFRREIRAHLILCLQEEGRHDEARRIRDGDAPDP